VRRCCNACKVQQLATSNRSASMLHLQILQFLQFLAQQGRLGYSMLLLAGIFVQLQSRATGSAALLPDLDRSSSNASVSGTLRLSTGLSAQHGVCRPPAAIRISACSSCSVHLHLTWHPPWLPCGMPPPGLWPFLSVGKICFNDSVSWAKIEGPTACVLEGVTSREIWPQRDFSRYKAACLGFPSTTECVDCLAPPAPPAQLRGL
jgi:hypothetical protein